MCSCSAEQSHERRCCCICRPRRWRPWRAPNGARASAPQAQAEVRGLSLPLRPQLPPHRHSCALTLNGPKAGICSMNMDCVCIVDSPLSTRRPRACRRLVMGLQCTAGHQITSTRLIPVPLCRNPSFSEPVSRSNGAALGKATPGKRQTRVSAFAQGCNALHKTQSRRLWARWCRSWMMLPPAMRRRRRTRCGRSWPRCLTSTTSTRTAAWTCRNSAPP